MSHASTSPDCAGPCSPRATAELTHRPDGQVVVRVTGDLSGMPSFSELRQSCEVGLAMAGPPGLLLDLRGATRIKPLYLAFVGILTLRAMELGKRLQVHVTVPYVTAVLDHLETAAGDDVHLDEDGNGGAVFTVKARPSQ